MLLLFNAEASKDNILANVYVDCSNNIREGYLIKSKSSEINLLNSVKIEMLQCKKKLFIIKPTLVFISFSYLLVGIGLYGCQEEKAVTVKNTRIETVPVKKQFPERRKIAFISNRDGIYGIYTMDEDGGNQQNLTNNPLLGGRFFGSFSLSPDGKKIAFTLGGRLVYQLYVMNSDGSGFVKLADISVHKESPSWSPDGKKIIFSSESDIYLANADGSELRKLKNIPLANNPQPFWSPDGNKILFKSYKNNSISLDVMNADGSGKKIIGDFSPFNPSWSPDGKKMVMELYAGKRNSDIFTMNVDGSERKRLTNSNAGMPSWSPDGNKIAFTSDNEIYIMNTDGSEQKNLTSYPSTGNRSPRWSPDGKKIVFVSIRDLDPEIYIMNADGSGQKRLTYNTGDDDMPCWSPN